MRIIRRQDNPLLIKAFDHSELNTLNDFDPAVYEEVEAEALPEGWQLEAPPKSLNQQLEEAFLPLLAKHLGKPYCSDAVLAEVFKTKVAIIDANMLGLLPVTQALVKSLNLPNQMETDRQALLQKIEQAAQAQGGL